MKLKRDLCCFIAGGVVVAACGSDRSFDNPPEVVQGTVASTVATTQPTTTAFVPTTAPTTLPPSTQPQTLPTNAPAPPTTPVPTTGERYTVVSGDTLFGIARKLNVQFDSLLNANGMNENSQLLPGQSLAVPQGGSVPPTNPPQTAAPTQPPQTQPPQTQPPPATTGERYTVVAGDTLFGISQKLGVPLDALLAANGMNENSSIVPGQTLAVPQGGSVPDTTRPPQTQPPQTQPPQTQPPPQQQPTTTIPAPPDAVVPNETSASCQAPDSEEADGTPVQFNPGNVLDRNPATVWRCPAPATGESLSFSFDSPRQLTSVGLIGGYDKTDPTTEVDRFIQNHRVREVRWTFSDGTTVDQNLEDARSMQTMNVDVVTTSVTLEIRSTYPPGGEAPRDMVPVAEVQFTGGQAPQQSEGPDNGGPDNGGPDNGASLPQGLRVNQTKASCQAPDSEDADGNTVVFDPNNVNDRDPSTAWRCAAPATGQTMEFTLQGQQRLTSVGLIGGYTKVDPTTEVDRFTQNYRVRRVRWTFDDGTEVVQDLQDSRELQTINVDVTTHRVVLEIRQVYEPNHEFPREFVAISEVVLAGDG